MVLMMTPCLLFYVDERQVDVQLGTVYISAASLVDFSVMRYSGLPLVSIPALFFLVHWLLTIFLSEVVNSVTLNTVSLNLTLYLQLGLVSFTVSAGFIHLESYSAIIHIYVNDLCMHGFPNDILSSTGDTCA